MTVFKGLLARLGCWLLEQFGPDVSGLPEVLEQFVVRGLTDPAIRIAQLELMTADDCENRLAVLLVNLDELSGDQKWFYRLLKDEVDCFFAVQEADYDSER